MDKTSTENVPLLLMPKNRKLDYSAHQADASRAKKKVTAKKKTPSKREDVNQAAARILREATKT